MAKKSKEPPVDDLNGKQARAEHARLAAEIAAHDKRYYQDDAPTVSDAEYDRLRRRYQEIEARFPDLRTLESLSLRVGVAPARGFAKVRHSVPMLSLDNAFNGEELRAWHERMVKIDARAATTPLTVEVKIDGVQAGAHGAIEEQDAVVQRL